VKSQIFIGRNGRTFLRRKIEEFKETQGITPDRYICEKGNRNKRLRWELDRPFD